jgi:hypothetical protein
VLYFAPESHNVSYVVCEFYFLAYGAVEQLPTEKRENMHYYIATAQLPTIL